VCPRVIDDPLAVGFEVLEGAGKGDGLGSKAGTVLEPVHEGGTGGLGLASAGLAVRGGFHRYWSSSIGAGRCFADGVKFRPIYHVGASDETITVVISLGRVPRQITGLV
jgi:hypothetical protein